MSINLNTPKPGFQDSLRSKVVRTALEETDAAANNLQAQINAIITPASGAETSNARDFFETVRDRLRSGFSGLGNVVISGGSVSAQSAPDMTVKVGAVEAVVNGVGVNLGVNRTWTRVAGVITITEASHTLSDGDMIHVEQSSDPTGALAVSSYAVSNSTTNTFDITGFDGGDTSGTVTFGRDSGDLTALIPVSDIKLCYITVNSDATISVTAGLAAADPVFPTLAASNCLIGAVVLKDDTTELNDNVELFNFRHSVKGYPDQYIGTAQQIKPGKYLYNNLIIDAALDFSTPASPASQGIGDANWGSYNVQCEGYYYQLANITAAARSLYYSDGKSGAAGGDATNSGGGTGGGGGGSLPKNGYPTILTTGVSGVGGGSNYFSTGVAGQSEAMGGGGGGGGGSIFTSGGAGGAGGYAPGSPGFNLQNTGGAAASITAFIIIVSNNIYIDANITSTGATGGTGALASDTKAAAGGGGGGGSAGGNLFIISKNDIELTSNCTIDLSGGNGGNGGSATTGTERNAGGGGGGGGAGGNLLLRYKTITNDATISTDKGLKGTGGAASGGSVTNTAGSNGSDGVDGLQDFADYTDTTDLQNTILPVTSIYHIEV
jgi:DNA-binding protein